MGLAISSPAVVVRFSLMLRLAPVGTGRLAELVTDAWRMRAPAVLAADLGQTGSPPPIEPG